MAEGIDVSHAVPDMHASVCGFHCLNMYYMSM